MSSKTMEKQWKKMKKMWLRCETVSDGKAMEKSRDYDEEVEKNNGKHIGKIAALMWDRNWVTLGYRFPPGPPSEVDLGRLQWRGK